MKNKGTGIFAKLKAKLTLRRAEKIYRSEGHRLRYYFQPGDSEWLIVSFSSFPGKWRRARYNYVRTLSGYRANRLFILDNFGARKKGSYYLGQNGDFFIERAVVGLIEETARKCGAKKRIFLGSSKGGTSAVYFGMKYGCDVIVAGAPQYYIGNYLLFPKHLRYLRYIMGDASKESAERLNVIVPDAIRNVTGPRRVYLHYSDREHTYAEHIADMIRDLRRQPGVTLFQDRCDYTDHGAVGKYFPAYIRKVLLRELSQKAGKPEKVVPKSSF